MGEVFPSPCGVWVVSLADSINYHIDSVSVPLRGVGCFMKSQAKEPGFFSFRPLAGCGLFQPHRNWVQDAARVSVPLRGVGCFLEDHDAATSACGFRPLAGCGLFRQSCTFFLVQQEKELSTLLFYCIILADGLSIAN